MARHLFGDWATVSKRVRSAAAVRLFLDFDGTLAPLCARPEDVALSVETRHALSRLVRHDRVRAAIVSGRRRGDLIRQVSVRRLEYWGLYGWERSAGWSLPGGARALVSQARDRVASRLSGLDGIRLEDKRLGFSVHFREASRTVVRRARDRLRLELADYEDDLHVVVGEKSWNVLPREVTGKGAAVRQAIGRLRTPFLPIYVGDDATDEPAFAVLGRGVTVRVGSARQTRAQYRLSNPDQVRSFIERLDGELNSPIRPTRSQP